jgi:hypothetical protein
MAELRSGRRQELLPALPEVIPEIVQAESAGCFEYLTVLIWGSVKLTVDGLGFCRC